MIDSKVKTFTSAYNIITKKFIFETSNRRKELIFFQKRWEMERDGQKRRCLLGFSNTKLLLKLSY